MAANVGLEDSRCLDRSCDPQPLFIVCTVRARAMRSTSAWLARYVPSYIIRLIGWITHLDHGSDASQVPRNTLMLEGNVARVKT